MENENAQEENWDYTSHGAEYMNKALETLSQVVTNLSDDGQAAAAARPIYIVDRYVTKPGDGKSVMDDYLAYYAPIAKQGGAELVNTLVAPPVWLSWDSNVVVFVWKVIRTDGGWGIAWPRMVLPDFPEWCEKLHERVVDYERSFYADPADMEVLSNV